MTRRSIGVAILLRSVASFVAALCACAASVIHTDVSEFFEVDVRLRVDRSLASRRVTDQLKTEAEAMWGPYGVRLGWSNDGAAPESAGNDLSLDASLEREFERRLRSQWPAVLGRAVRVDGSNWRSIGLSFAATESFLAHRPTTRLPMAGVVLDSELARALGRVLAHEIGHVLLGAPYHDPTGLMRASFRPEEIGEPDRTPFRLTCSGVERLRGRLRVLGRGPQRVNQHSSTSLDSGASVGASCIPGY